MLDGYTFYTTETTVGRVILVAVNLYAWNIDLASFGSLTQSLVNVTSENDDLFIV